MKSILILILGTLFVVPIFAESWTVLVYMAADNNLWQNAVQDVNDMESVEMPDNLDLIVQTDMPAGSDYPGGQRRNIHSDTSSAITSTVLSNLGTIDSGDPQTLRSFINWGFQHYPAQRKMLVIWGHGDNWFKSNEPKWICPDDGSQNLISVSAGELKEALTGIPALDILLFDACSMQSVEVLAEVMNAADYVVGSEELVPAAGFPYQTIVPLFASGTVEQIAVQIPQEYLESYEAGGIQNPNGFTNPITCSTINTSYLPAFYANFQDYCLHWSYAANMITWSFRDDLWEMNTAYCDVDIGEFLAYVQEHISYPDPMMAARLGQLQEKWNDCVLLSGSINISHDIGSAAIWYPWHRQYFDPWWQQYQQLTFADCRWLRFLNSGLLDNIPPDQPTVSDIQTLLGTVKFLVTQPADPDSLMYQINLVQDGGPEFEYFFYYPEFRQETFWAQLPVTASGSVIIRSLDTAANWSEPRSFRYEFSGSEFALLIAPNPLRDKSLASVRWFLPDELLGEVELYLYNLRGQNVLHKAFVQDDPGEGIWLLSAEEKFRGLGRGTYILKLKAGKKEFHQKLTIL